MVTWVMGGRVGSMGPISTSTITINSLYKRLRGGVYGIFRPRSTSTIINTYIVPYVTIIGTYTSPPVNIIAPGTTPISSTTTIYYSLINMIILVNKKIRN